ncbi:MAG: hypothetical protein RL757_2345 [Bacteroidota bacterium]|jgi:predicted DNA-binding transcriptional regulator YafY
MATEKEYTGRIRTLRILRALVELPFYYTKKELARIYNVSLDTIKDDFTAIESAGFDLQRDDRHRYGLVTDKHTNLLKSLLIFTSREEDLLTNGLQRLGLENKEVEKLSRKLSRIYDISKMHNVFDKGFLTKMDLLEKAKKEKKVVILKDYHSTNSSTVKNRRVEVFHISAEEDLIHAFDLEAKAIRHFRISRIFKVEIMHDVLWQYEGHHVIVATDPFRIQNNEQKKVHILMRVGAYNELIERFPLTRGHLKDSLEGNETMYELVCYVNAKFYGLTNFLLGSYDNIIAIEPQILVEHLKNEAQKLLEKDL